MTLVIRRLLLVTIVSLVALPLSAATLDGMKIHSTSTGHGSKAIVLVHNRLLTRFLDSVSY
jgi:hypothetical protein